MTEKNPDPKQDTDPEQVPNPGPHAIDNPDIH